MNRVIKEGTLRLQTIESTCDIILSCNGQKLMAHKLILSIASPIFRDILQKNPNSSIVILPDVHAKIMNSILDYIYTGTTMVYLNDIEDFISLANFFQVEFESKYLECFLEEKKEVFTEVDVKKKEEELNFTKDFVNNNIVFDNSKLTLNEKDKVLIQQEEKKVSKLSNFKITKNIQKYTQTKDLETRDKNKSRKKLPNLLPLQNILSQSTNNTQSIKTSSCGVIIPSPWRSRVGDSVMEDPRRVYLRGSKRTEVQRFIPTTDQKEDNNNNNCSSFTPYFPNPSHLPTSSYVPNKLNSVIKSLYLNNNNNNINFSEPNKNFEGLSCGVNKRVSVEASATSNCSRESLNLTLNENLHNENISKNIKDKVSINTNSSDFIINKSKKSLQYDVIHCKKTYEPVLKSILNSKKTLSVKTSTNNRERVLNNSEKITEPLTINKTVLDSYELPINLTQSFTKFREEKNSLVTKSTVKDLIEDSDNLDTSYLDNIVDNSGSDSTIAAGCVLKTSKARTDNHFLKFDSTDFYTQKKDGGEEEAFLHKKDKQKSDIGGKGADEDCNKNSKKIFECVDCKKGFSQLRNYKYHRSLHEGTKEFSAKCPECGKTFNDKGYMSSHMKIHRDKKEYECPSCPKRFNQRVAYNMHLRIHTGLKPHQCPICQKNFSRKMLLKQHQRVHTGERPYSCPECGKSFADRSNMSLHARLHTGVKPYACDLCSKSFTKKHHLKTHMNFHTGLKPYSCKNCGLAFSQSSNMRTHYKKCILRTVRKEEECAAASGSSE